MKNREGARDSTVTQVNDGLKTSAETASDEHGLILKEDIDTICR
jgi:hypothetical protein